MVWILLFSVIRSVEVWCVYLYVFKYVLYLGGLFSALDEFLYGFNKM